MKDLGFRVWALGFKDLGFGASGQGSGPWVEGFSVSEWQENWEEAGFIVFLRTCRQISKTFKNSANPVKVASVGSHLAACYQGMKKSRTLSSVPINGGVVVRY